LRRFQQHESGFRRQIYNPYSTRASGSTFVRDPFRCDASGNPLPVNAQRQQDQTIGTACNKIPQALILRRCRSSSRPTRRRPNFSDARDLTNNFNRTRPTINNSNSYQGRVDHRFNDKDNYFLPLHRTAEYDPDADWQRRLHRRRLARPELRRWVDARLSPESDPGCARLATLADRVWMPVSKISIQPGLIR
jgi:hypothetical protein